MNDAGPIVDVRAVAAGGDGVASLPDGRTVFIPRAAPGDHLRLRRLRMHARFARAEIAELLAPGPDRVEPSCEHYVVDRCGSCQVMHLSQSAQLSVKSRIAGDALRRIAHLDVDDPAMIAGTAAFGYRTKVTFAIRDGRIGYHPVNDPGSVIEIRDCPIADQQVRLLHAALRAARSHLPGNGSRVVLRVDRAGAFHVVVRTVREQEWTGANQLQRAIHAAGVAASIWWHPDGGRARVMAGGDASSTAVVFEQVNPAVGRMVRRAAIDALGDVAGQSAWDLYAGIGETTAELAMRRASVDSIELEPAAVRLAESAGPSGPHRHAGRVEDLIATLTKAEVVVTNPPRTGMAGSATEALADSGARRIAYVSCDPATLARDLARLDRTYRLDQFVGFDQFPQTAHLECLAVLERR